MKWSEKPPTVPGHYWWRATPKTPLCVVWVEYNNRGLRVYHHGSTTSSDPTVIGGLWLGPLPEPE